MTEEGQTRHKSDYMGATEVEDCIKPIIIKTTPAMKDKTLKIRSVFSFCFVL